MTRPQSRSVIIVWIVIGIIAILVAIKAYQYASQPLFFLPKPPPAVLQIQGDEQEGHACIFGPGGLADNFSYTAQTSNKALITSSPFSATLKFTADKPPQTIRIPAHGVGMPTGILYTSKTFVWDRVCFIDNAKGLDSKNKQIFTLELASGLYVITVSADWEQSGEAIYAFLVEVK